MREQCRSPFVCLECASPSANTRIRSGSRTNRAVDITYKNCLWEGRRLPVDQALHRTLKDNTIIGLLQRIFHILFVGRYRLSLSIMVAGSNFCLYLALSPQPVEISTLEYGELLAMTRCPAAQQCANYWKGTVPCCSPSSDCGPIHRFNITDRKGDGALCFTGIKKLCECVITNNPACVPISPPAHTTILHGWITLRDNGCNVFICGNKRWRFWSAWRSVYRQRTCL